MYFKAFQIKMNSERKTDWARGSLWGLPETFLNTNSTAVELHLNRRCNRLRIFFFSSSSPAGFLHRRQNANSLTALPSYGSSRGESRSLSKQRYPTLFSQTQCPWMSQLYSMLLAAILMHRGMWAAVAGSWGTEQQEQRPAVLSGLLQTRTGG